MSCRKIECIDVAVHGDGGPPPFGGEDVHGGPQIGGGDFHGDHGADPAIGGAGVRVAHPAFGGGDGHGGPQIHGDRDADPAIGGGNNFLDSHS